MGTLWGWAFLMSEVPLYAWRLPPGRVNGLPRRANAVVLREGQQQYPLSGEAHKFVGSEIEVLNNV
jgi:hypothetical protein